MTHELFTAGLVPAPLAAATSDAAFVQAMLDVEAALAAAQAGAGLIPTPAAAAIGAAADAARFDIPAIAAQVAQSGTPAELLVRALRAVVGEPHADHVHLGATSQDIVDTAAMLVARRSLVIVLAALGDVADACAVLATAHRRTLMAGRTLLQHAVPTTFGLKAAGWMAGVDDARRRLMSADRERLAVQLGGAAGTLSVLGADGPAIAGGLATRLGLAEPVLPWHAARGRVADVAGALDEAAGAVAKIALDVVLLAQTEVGEVAEPSAPGRGGSSTMPHKRNPVGSTLALAGARRVHAAATLLTGTMVQEHERAVGAWQAEWAPWTDALALTGGVAATMAPVLAGLEVHPERMRANLDLTGGLPMAERVAGVLAPALGAAEAKRLVRDAALTAARAGTPLRAALEAVPEIAGALSAEALDDALDPAGYLGAADAFIDRALRHHEEI